MRILYVDDHTPFRAVVQRRFLAGHDVVGAATLAEARQRLSEGPFDYVMLDYTLPDGSGPELISEIVRDGRTCRVIAVSTNPEQTAEMTAAGAVGAISKNEFGHLADRLIKLEASLGGA